MSEFLCFLDNDDGEEGCVFDSGEIDCCDEATRLVKDGYSKCHCHYWKNAEGEMERQEAVKERCLVKFAIKADAAKLREEMVQNQFQTDMYLASIKPEFIQTMNGTVSNREARRVHPGHRGTVQDRASDQGGCFQDRERSSTAKTTA